MSRFVPRRRERRAFTAVLLPLLSGLAGSLYLPAAHAQKIWDAGAPDDNWFTPANWAGDTLPIATDNVVSIFVSSPIIFNGTGQPMQTINSLQSPGLFTHAGGTLAANAPGVSAFQASQGITVTGTSISQPPRLTGFVVNSPITLNPNSVLELNDVTMNMHITVSTGTLISAGTTTFAVGQSIDLDTASLFRLNGDQTLTGTSITATTFGGTAGASIAPHGNNATLTFGNGTTVSGRILSLGDFPLLVSGSNRSIVNNGTIHANHSGFTTTIGADNFTNGGDGLLTATDGAILIIAPSNSAANQGTIRADGGTIHFNRDTDNTGGVIETVNNGVIHFNAEVTGGTFAFSSGQVGGGGSIGGDVTNDGSTINPGNSPGLLTIDGNYTQNSGGILAIELGGLTPGTQFDVLDVNGTATLDGTLTVSLINGFAPTAGDTFTFLTYDARGDVGGSPSGFDVFASGTPGLNYSVSYGATGATLTVLGPAAAAAPEPATLALLALGGIGLLGRVLRRTRPHQSIGENQ
jgi:hypothetical protein